MIPTNEQETIALFAQLANELGYEFKEIGTRCPDAILSKNGQEIRVEFEHKSKNFQRHQHDPDDVDLVICWQDDWPTCPLPVLTLETYVTLAKPVQPVPNWKRFLLWWKEFRLAYIDYRTEIRIARIKRKAICDICGGKLTYKCNYDSQGTYTERDGMWMQGALTTKCVGCGITELESAFTYVFFD